MDENLRQILNDSTGILSRLQLLSAFFEDEMVYKIYVKTQVIHQLFEHNRDLDINKLSLFHVQFTDTVIALLRKVKQANEKNVGLLYDELQVDKEMIAGLGNSTATVGGFREDQSKQALKVGLSLRKLYQALSDGSKEYPFSRNINEFGRRYALDFFVDISPALFGELIRYNPAEVYSNEYALIQRRLMGQLLKGDFHCTFHTGLHAGNQSLEVYRFGDPSKFFLFGAGNIFLFVDPARIPDAGSETGVSKRARLIRELTDKNTRLESNIAAARAYIPDPVKSLLAEYYHKISEINFLVQSDFEIQANILKTMLNTDSI